MSDSTDEFESYIARRRVRRRWGIALGLVVLVATVAVPYALAKHGFMKHDTFEIFVAADFFVFLGLVRALVIYLSDRAGAEIG